MVASWDVEAIKSLIQHFAPGLETRVRWDAKPSERGKSLATELQTVGEATQASFEAAVRQINEFKQDVARRALSSVVVRNTNS